MMTSDYEMQRVLSRLASLEAKSKKMERELESEKKKSTAVQKDYKVIKRQISGLRNGRPGTTRSNQAAGGSIQTPMSQLRKMQSVLSRALVAATNGLAGKNKGMLRLSQRLQPLETRIFNVNNSEVFIQYDLSNIRLSTGKQVKLDEVNEVTTNAGGCFDSASCCYTPLVSGRYLVIVSFAQADKGKITMWVKNNKTLHLPIGKTDRHTSTASGPVVLRLESDQSVWFEAERVEGSASIRWCDFYCRLL